MCTQKKCSNGEFLNRSLLQLVYFTAKQALETLISLVRKHILDIFAEHIMNKSTEMAAFKGIVA
jgi:hypothetical protein